MEKFNVVRVRFHIEEKQTLVIQGWQYNRKPEDRLAITLDGEELPWIQKSYDGMEVRQRYMIYDLGIEEEYFLYVTLPESLDGKKELVLWVVDGEKASQGEQKRAVYREKVPHLQKLQNEIDFFLEQVTLDQEHCYIKGWAASAVPVEIQVKGPGGRLLDREVSWHERRDVNQVYREISALPDSGFEVVLPHRGMSGVSLELSDGSRRSQVKVPIVSTFFFENVLGNSYLGKGARFLQRHGFKQFCTRTMQVLAKKAVPQGDYEKYRQAVMPTKEELEKQRKEVFSPALLFSIVVPLYKTPEKYLEQLVESVRRQTYGNWELCLSDGSGKDSPLEKYLKKLENQDARIKVIYNSKPLQISENTNAGLKAARGDFVVFADHDDLLTPDALYECAKALQKHPDTELIYSDEDKISMNGKHYFQPHFKSDYNPDLICSMNYFCQNSD